ncbi:flocculation protein FLO11 [Aplysia californica]|uniref:Flocculation protein FLO11 n=1 Tax=Aplysia californica TaxID=6500 RepID=A0ABM0K6H1_APLCA|nr:flocculation protein FLO11 [Aplysia californica]XP_005109880.1 flocculation protein FLO11 [Aplysia californica]
MAIPRERTAAYRSGTSHAHIWSCSRKSSFGDEKRTSSCCARSTSGTRQQVSDSTVILSSTLPSPRPTSSSTDNTTLSSSYKMSPKANPRSARLATPSTTPSSPRPTGLKKESIQRLTNGGIPLTARRRRLSLDAAVAATEDTKRHFAESQEPRSILKTGTRRSSVTYIDSSSFSSTCDTPSTSGSFTTASTTIPIQTDLLSLSSSPSLSSLTLSSCSSRQLAAPTTTTTVVKKEGIEVAPLSCSPTSENSSEDGLRRFRYKLPVEPITSYDVGPKRVTFDDDVLVIPKSCHRERRLSLPSKK